MSGLNAEGWQSYGDNIVLALDGVWAQRGSAFGVGATDTLLAIPYFETEGKYWLTMLARGAGMRRVIGGAAKTAIGMCRDIYMPSLPPENESTWLFVARDGTNAPILTLALTTDGNIVARNFANTIVTQTSAPCIRAGTVHKIQAEMTFHATLGALEVRVDGVTVISATNLVMTGTATQYFLGLSDSAFPATAVQYNSFIVVYSLAGSYNNSWPAISGIQYVWPAADTATAGFTPRPRQDISTGVLYIPGSGSLLDGGTSSGYALGAGDYTLETNVRFNEPVPVAEFATLFGDWIAATSLRSYRLVKYGANTNAGHLRFEVTTDGTLGTLVAVQDIVWEPEVGRWYNIAISRVSGVNYLFIDGLLIAPGVADANNYFIGTSFTIGGEKSGPTTVLAASSLNGMQDQTRVTKGVGRYTTTYTPTTQPFPTSSPADPNFASVTLLLLYDENLNDQSPLVQTTTARGSAAQNVPADAPPAYLTINAPAPLDDRFLEAALVSATGVLTLTALPANTQAVTLGATTYTYNTSLGGANSVLIGASVAASLDNLRNAINAGPGSGTTYGTGTTQNASALAAAGPASNQITATAITPGVAGNAIVSTETLTAGSWTGTTLLGGADIPAPSRFTLTPLPPTVTGVRWIEARKRSFVDAGAGKLQLAFVVTGSTASGADQSLTSNPTYYADTFESDPHTSAGLTPTSITNGSIRLTRTS